MDKGFPLIGLREIKQGPNFFSRLYKFVMAVYCREEKEQHKILVWIFSFFILFF